MGASLRELDSLKEAPTDLGAAPGSGWSVNATFTDSESLDVAFTDQRDTPRASCPQRPRLSTDSPSTPVEHPHGDRLVAGVPPGGWGYTQGIRTPAPKPAPSTSDTSARSHE
ncbi:hypothetical protein GCM10023192_42740 [Amycolatopsis samaneae]